MMMTIGGLPRPESNLELVFVTYKCPPTDYAILQVDLHSGQ